MTRIWWRLVVGWSITSKPTHVGMSEPEHDKAAPSVRAAPSSSTAMHNEPQKNTLMAHTWCIAFLNAWLLALFWSELKRVTILWGVCSLISHVWTRDKYVTRAFVPYWQWLVRSPMTPPTTPTAMRTSREAGLATSRPVGRRRPPAAARQTGGLRWTTKHGDASFARVRQ